MHYRDVIKTPRWEDMDIKYAKVTSLSKTHPRATTDKRTYQGNRFAFMGIGRHMVQSEKGRALNLDASPYTDVKRVDHRFFVD